MEYFLCTQLSANCFSMLSYLILITTLGSRWYYSRLQVRKPRLEEAAQSDVGFTIGQ